MILISTNDYKKKMGNEWSMGMITEMVRIFNYTTGMVVLDAGNLPQKLEEYIKDKGWDSKHVVGVYISADTVFDNMVANELFQNLTKDGRVPCYAILTSDIETEEQFIRMATKLSRMKAFL